MALNSQSIKKWSRFMTTRPNPSRLHSYNLVPSAPEEPMEIVRQMKQHWMLARCLGGPLPTSIDLSEVKRVLDLGCGAGDWVLEMAHRHRDIEFTGIDQKCSLIEYARARAESQKLENADFVSYDIFSLSESSFPSESFDLLYLSFLTGSVPFAAFPMLVRYIQRLCRRGGKIVWTEANMPFTTSSTCIRFTRIVARAMRKAELAPCPNPLTVGITAQMANWLQEAGYRSVQEVSPAIDVSAGAEAHFTFVEQIKAFSYIIEPFLLKMGGTTPEELEALRNQMAAEMRLKAFSGKVFLKSVWAERT